MCTLALYFRMFDELPLIVAANRDEHYDRPSAAPELWAGEPLIVAGKDLLAGGTWLGMNDRGLVTGILNRRSTGKSEGKTRSRGLLCLDLLKLGGAAEARRFMQSHEESYAPFTIVFADRHEAWVAYNEERKIRIAPLDLGLHVFSNTSEFRGTSDKLERAYKTFVAAAKSFRRRQPGPRDWLQSLPQALADHTLTNGSSDLRDAICVHGPVSGTVSSTILYLHRSEARFYSFFSPGPPCRTAFGDPLVLELQ